ncbi:uncharacterized protein LOC121051174 [Rosa chinensis]|uniref:uncharacterized protein LOC121051174 n=1 Tax=Rosa chinensis TaxID=74649 RepID=UPI001AD8B354|nr:uncharacterized protein LOC121051174 [Rosa chinensis]
MEKGVAKAKQMKTVVKILSISSVTGISSTGDRSSGFGYVVVVELYGEVLGNKMRLGCRLFTQVSSFLALAVTVAAEVVKTMVAKRYVLGQDALIKGICQNNESYQVSVATTSKVYELAIEYGLIKAKKLFNHLNS